tara:strand:+ start:600 stop:767 length:168 start_codon:yes stop_codon:yes gene_type:complete
MSDALLEWQYWLTAPERARDRWQLLIASLILIALIALIALNAALTPIHLTPTIPT